MSRIEAITARLNAATPGPWTFDQIPETGECGIFGGPNVWHPEGNSTVAAYAHLSDAEFIAHAPSDIGYLLGRVAELETQKDAVLAIHQRIEAINYRFTPPQPSGVCSGCGQDNGNWSVWPCATVRALGGPEHG